MKINWYAVSIDSALSIAAWAWLEYLEAPRYVCVGIGSFCGFITARLFDSFASIGSKP